MEVRHSAVIDFDLSKVSDCIGSQQAMVLVEICGPRTSQVVGKIFPKDQRIDGDQNRVNDASSQIFEKMMDACHLAYHTGQMLGQGGTDPHKANEQTALKIAAQAVIDAFGPDEALLSVAEAEALKALRAVAQ